MLRWVPYYRGVASPQVADGGHGLQIRRVAADILNKLSQATEKGWSSSFVIGSGANNCSP
jgi:hypothetical protein